MVRKRSNIYTTCPNRKCKYFKLRKKKNIVKRGKNSKGAQRYYCKNCKTWFISSINTPFYYKHLSHEDIIQICRLLIEGNSIRGIERITGHHRDTIGRLIKDLSKNKNLIDNILYGAKLNAKRFHEKLSHNIRKKDKKSKVYEKKEHCVRCLKFSLDLNKIGLCSECQKGTKQLKKICSKCNKELSINNFYTDIYKKDGFKNSCKKCYNKICLQYQKDLLDFKKKIGLEGVSLTKIRYSLRLLDFQFWNNI